MTNASIISSSVSTPFVSVIICNYNYGRFLPEAITSAINQTYRNLEVVVIDDGSTDESANVIRIQPPSVKCIRTTNQGQLAAFWTGIQAARGEILCLLDSDDIWLPTKVEEVVDVFCSFPDIQWVRHKLQLVDQALRPLGVCVPEFSSSGRTSTKPYRYLEKTLNLSTTGLSLRRCMAEFAFPRLDSHLRTAAPSQPFGGVRYHADACLLPVIAANRIPGFSLARVLGFYRRHSLQRHHGDASTQDLLLHEIEVAHLLTRIWWAETGYYFIPSHFYKHLLVLHASTQAGHSIRLRTRLFWAGLQAAARAANSDFCLTLRQTTALLYALFAPHLWTKRLNLKRSH